MAAKIHVNSHEKNRQSLRAIDVIAPILVICARAGQAVEAAALRASVARLGASVGAKSIALRQLYILPYQMFLQKDAQAKIMKIVQENNRDFVRKINCRSPTLFDHTGAALGGYDDLVAQAEEAVRVQVTSSARKVPLNNNLVKTSHICFSKKKAQEKFMDKFLSLQ